MSDDIFTVKVPDLIIISVSCFKHMTKSGKVTLHAFFFFFFRRGSVIVGKYPRDVT